MVKNTPRGYGVGAPLLDVFPAPLVWRRAPVSTDIGYRVGQEIVNEVTTIIYQLAGIAAGVATWIVIGSGSSGSIQTITGDSGGAEIPLAGNFNLLGTANQITVTGTANTETFSVPAAFIAPGSIASTTTLTSGTSLAVTTSATVGTTLGVTGLTTLAALTQVGTANINASGAGVTTIGTGGTGAVNIGNATGNTAVTGALSTTTTATIGTGLTVSAGGILVSGGDIINSHSDAATDVTIEVTNSDNTSGTSRSGVEIAVGGASSGDPYLSFQISGVGASTMTMGLDNSASDLLVISNSATVGTSNALTLSQAGALAATTSVTAGTTVTATLGDITATNGNLVLGTAGNKIVSTSVGNAAAAGANAFGTVTLVNGTVTVSTTAVTASSVIILTRQSVGATGANDLGILSVGAIVAATSFVIDAWTVTNATALQADDQSIIGWMIIN